MTNQLKLTFICSKCNFCLTDSDRSVQNAISDVGFSRAGIAAAVAVPLVAVGSLALLSPLALGRKKRDLDAAEESEGDYKFCVVSRVSNADLKL